MNEVCFRGLYLLHRLYKLTISPLLGPRCRFYPYCSDYALEAVRIHGLVKGSMLACKRICRCHPWNEGGVDCVPQKGVPEKRVSEIRPIPEKKIS